MRTPIHPVDAGPSRFAAVLVALVAALVTSLPPAMAAETANTTFQTESRGNGARTARDVQTDEVRLQDRPRRAFERLNEREIKRYYHACTDEAVNRRIGSSEIAVCSVAYDVLLTRHFGGDFIALLAWSRAQRGEPSE
jgi:hypothetical protein